MSSTRSEALPAAAPARPAWLRRLPWLVGAALLAAALRATLLAPKPVPVTVFHVALGPVEETVTNSKAGTVRSRRRASLSPEIGGRVAELPVREGQRVRAGQLLVRIADADLRAQVTVQRRARDAAVAGEREADKALQQIGRDLERNESLAASRIVSQSLGCSRPARLSTWPR